ncbi:hypothetical protein K523DRAFT_415315 [Schizophyllum commune Tattone D]|nr:hypothetical protein K523DRAFT_415315 [Schizophyllum commune Tattone D]
MSDADKAKMVHTRANKTMSSLSRLGITSEEEMDRLMADLDKNADEVVSSEAESTRRGKQRLAVAYEEFCVLKNKWDPKLALQSWTADNLVLKVVPFLEWQLLIALNRPRVENIRSATVHLWASLLAHNILVAAVDLVPVEGTLTERSCGSELLIKRGLFAKMMDQVAQALRVQACFLYSCIGQQ